MSTLQTPANPFALLLDPQAVLARVEHSQRLERLHRRVCRPLDKPVLPGQGGTARDFDRSVDEAGDEPAEADTQ
ncbi:MAG: hypothetical protein HUU30_05750 [Burkholderiaceae bacterium]|jgi:hypothetical protein|nr:hypothetical protein [Aquabacterium sp.]NUP85244.1 hypothetical protein [Burkholderiaceae bacterium]